MNLHHVEGSDYAGNGFYIGWNFNTSTLIVAVGRSGYLFMHQVPLNANETNTIKFRWNKYRLIVIVNDVSLCNAPPRLHLLKRNSFFSRSSLSKFLKVGRPYGQTMSNLDVDINYIKIWRHDDVFTSIGCRCK